MAMKKNPARIPIQISGKLRPLGRTASGSAEEEDDDKFSSKYLKRGSKSELKIASKQVGSSENLIADQALLDAAEQGNITLVRLLVDQHKDDASYINASDKMGATALHCAALGPQLDVCEYLLKEGANVMAVNQESTTPLHYLVRKAPRTSHSFEDQIPALSLADQLGRRRTSQYLRILDKMIEKGASIDAQSVRMESPLHQAVLKGNEEAVRWLLANHAEIHLLNKFKETPLDSLRGQENIISEMLELAEENVNSTSRELLTWGYGPYGQLGYAVTASGTSDRIQLTPKRSPDPSANSPFQDRSIVSVACGAYVTTAVTSAGEVFAWGRGNAPPQLTPHCPLLGNGKENDEVTPIQIPMPVPIRSVSLGTYHGAAISREGLLFMWGYGGNGQLGIGNKDNLITPKPLGALTGVVQVACGETHTVVLTTGGKVYTWGGNENGQLGHGDTTDRITPTQVLALGHIEIVRVACSSTHTLCLSVEGKVYIFGVPSAEFARAPLTTPQHVHFFEEKGLKISGIGCGHYMCVAVSEIGDVYTWGTGKFLGHGDITAESSPKMIEAVRDKSVRKIECGATHFVFMTDKGHLYSVGRDGFGQCGTAKGDTSVPVRISSYTGVNVATTIVTGNPNTASPSSSNQAVLRNVVAFGCGDKHSACVLDTVRSTRDRYAWKLLELKRSMLRAVYAITEVYHLPLKARSIVSASAKTINLNRAKSISTLSAPIIPEEELNSIFSQADPLQKFLSKTLALLDNRMDAYVPGSTLIGDLFATLLDDSSVLIQYLDSLPKAFFTLENICDASPQFIGYLQECKKHAETVARKSDPHEEESRDFDLGSLLVEPFFSCERFLKYLEPLLRHTPDAHPDRANLEAAFNHLSVKIPFIREQLIQKERALGKAPSVRSLNSSFEGLQEYRHMCKSLFKQAKKLAEAERAAAEERAMFAAALSQIRACMDSTESKAAAALDSYADFNRALSNIESSYVNKSSNDFATPLMRLVIELDETLPNYSNNKKVLDDSNADYCGGLSKLLQAAKQKDPKPDPKRIQEMEKEVQGKKKHLDILTNDQAGRLNHVSAKKAGGQYALVRSIRAHTDAINTAHSRSKVLQPHVDSLEFYLRTNERKIYSAQLATLITTELATLPVEHSSPTDAGLLAPVLAKLDQEPINLSLPHPNYDPLVSLLAMPNLAAVNALVTTLTTGDQEEVLRNVLRVLDAYGKSIPLIKRAISAEIEATTDPSLIFRANSTSTKLMTAYTKLLGTNYLTRIIKPFIQEVLNLDKNAGLEVDPLKAKEGESLEENLARLVDISQKTLEAILRSVNEFPTALRVLASHLMREVSKKFPANRHNSVGGFVFLRFIGPALLGPGAYGLFETTQSDGARPLVLVWKLLQALSNAIEFGAKESFMVGANKFVTGNLDRVRNFFDQIASLPATHPLPPPIASMKDVSPDLKSIHLTLSKNLNKIVKSLAQYKTKDTIPRLFAVLVDLGDPSLTYPNHNLPSISSSASSSSSSLSTSPSNPERQHATPSPQPVASSTSTTNLFK